MPSTPQHRAWMFTLNNPQNPFDDPNHWLGNVEAVRYAVWQLERGAESGVVHYQGYVLLNGRGKRLAGMKALHRRCHWEVRRGTHAQAEEYCSKEDTRIRPPERLGEPPADGGPGARSDLVSVKRKLDARVSEKEIADEHFGSWCRYHKAFQRYAGLILPNRVWHSHTTVYWGPPGVGKTRRVSAEVSESVYWLPKPNGTRVFWDGYEGQEDVVIDEFFGWMPRDLMCRLCDRTPFRVETKGGSVPFVAKRIFITSNKAPNAWWSRIGLGPMVRRLSDDLGVVYEMLEDGSLNEGSGLQPILPQPLEGVGHDF